MNRKRIAAITAAVVLACYLTGGVGFGVSLGPLYVRAYAEPNHGALYFMVGRMGCLANHLDADLHGGCL